MQLPAQVTEHLEGARHLRKVAEYDEEEAEEQRHLQSRQPEHDEAMPYGACSCGVGTHLFPPKRDPDEEDDVGGGSSGGGETVPTAGSVL